MIGAVLGGLSAVASAISSIQNFQQAKDAQRSAQAFGKQLEGLRETNLMAGYQAQDLSSLSRQQTAQQTSQATQAVQGMGPEGAAQIANIYQAGRQAEAQTTKEQAALNQEVDLAKRQAAQGVQYRNLEAQRALLGSRLEGAQAAASDKYNAGISGIEGVIGGLGMAGVDLMGLTGNDYLDEQIAARRAEKRAAKLAPK